MWIPRTFSLWTVWSDKYRFELCVCCSAINDSAASITVAECIFSDRGIFSFDWESFRVGCTDEYTLEKIIDNIENYIEKNCDNRAMKYPWIFFDGDNSLRTVLSMLPLESSWVDPLGLLIILVAAGSLSLSSDIGIRIVFFAWPDPLGIALIITDKKANEIFVGNNYLHKHEIPDECIRHTFWHPYFARTRRCIRS